MVVGVAFTGYSVWSNYNMYNESEATARSVMDIGISTGVIIFGLSNPVGWTVLLGIGLGTGAEIYKYYKWEK